MIFSKQVAAHSALYQKRIKAVFGLTAQGVVNLAQLPTAKGGRMRVDTSFLRNSGGAELGRMPSGPSVQGEAGTTGEPLAAVLAKWLPDQSIFWGWSANYARAREFKDGFMRGAAEKWPEIVKRTAALVKARIQ